MLIFLAFVLQDQNNKQRSNVVNKHVIYKAVL